MRVAGLEKQGHDFVIAISVLALVAEDERQAVSVRTKGALARAKRVASSWGNPSNLSRRGVGSDRATR